MKSKLKTYSLRLKLKTYSLLGIAAVILLVWLFNTPPGLLGKADAIGYAVCHQIEYRTFHIGDRPISLCARCTGQYLGAVLAMLYAGLIGKERTGWPSKYAIALLSVFVLAYAIDGTNSYLHFYPNLDKLYLYEPNNTLRLLTGTGMGLVIGLGTWHIFQEVVWKKENDTPVLSGFWQWSVLLLLALGVDGLVLTENPLLLYPLTLISAFGVLGILTLLYTLIWTIVFRAENSFEHIRDLVWLLTAGFITAMLQIGVLDFVRYLFTGTWGGFHIG